MAGKYRRARGQSSSPCNSSESRNLLTQDSSEDELPSLSKHLLTYFSVTSNKRLKLAGFRGQGCNQG